MNRKRILHYALIVLLLTWGNAYSQSGPGKSAARGVAGSDQPPAFGKLDNSMVPHSPEAEAIIKNTALPVTLYTGMPQISVPIYEIKGKSISLPVALTYNFNGFKPMEVASRYGLGWSLQGEGVITRMVKGRLDQEDGNVLQQYDDYADANMLTRKQVELSHIADGQFDAEPDLYVFNCNGLSGKFIWMHGQAYMFPHQNIRIQKYGEGFLITAENGTRYSFQAYETSTKPQVEGALPLPTHKSAWFITEVISADLRDTIKYHYADYNYLQQPPMTDSYTIQNVEAMGSAVHNWSKTADVGTQITTQLLTSITYKNTRILFGAAGEARTDIYGGSSAIGSIEVSSNEPGSKFSKVFRLKHDYQNSKLNLRSVELTNAALDTARSQWYKFDYEGGLGSGVDMYSWHNVARSIDKWGYYNAAANENRMMFTADEIYNPRYTAGDRSVNESASKTNMLKKMTFPTGGYTLFEYEKNQHGNNLDDGPGLRVKKISMFDNAYADSAALVKEYAYNTGLSFYVDGISSSTVVVNNVLCGALQNTTNITYRTGPASLLSDLLSTPFYYQHVTETNRSSSAAGVSEYEFRNFVDENPDIYLYQKIDKAYKGGTLVPVKRVINKEVSIQREIFIGGGAELTDVIGTPDPPNTWACQLVPTPDQTQNVDGLEKVFRSVINSSYVSAYRRTDEVIDSTWDSNGLNPIRVAKKYYYDNPSYRYPTRIATADAFGDSLITYMKYPQDYLPAGVASRYTLDTAFSTARWRAAYNYGKCYDSLVTALIPYQPFSSNPGMFSATANSFHCETNFKTASSVVWANRDTALAQYYRGLTLARAASTIPQQKAMYWMQENNVLNPVIESYTVRKIGSNEFMLSATRNEYNLFNDAQGSTVAMPAGSSQLEVSDYLQKSSFLANTGDFYIRQTQAEYDSVLNLAAQWKINDVKQTFLWSYNNQYPVAVVTNAAATEIAYSSFEADGKGNWQYGASGVTRDLTAVTGDHHYRLSSGNISRSGLNSNTTYILSYWLKSGSASVNGGSAGTSVATRNGWTLYQQSLTGVTSVTLSGSGYVDELRLYPGNARLTTYTYEPLIGLTSTTDANNKVIYYEYDGLNRLVLIRDENRNILKQICYSYYSDSTQPCSEVNVAASWVNSGNATCQTGTGSYLTGHQLQLQVDENRNSPTFNQSRITDLGLNTTACPVNADWAATGNLRCVTGSGYNTGAQEKEEHDNNPYSALGNRWVSNGTNTTACPIAADWQPTGNLRCVTGSGYNTGAQEKEEHDNNPYSAQGNRWVSNGTNTTACPITADWQPTGNLRCVTGSGYNTGAQEKEEHDNNPYSAQGNRWVSNGTNTTACPITADWQPTGNLRCVTGSGYNTGAQEKEEHDNNPYSAQGNRWVSNGTNTTACPITPDWQPTGTYQCVLGTGGFATSEQQQQQHDNNPYSGLGYRWVSVGTNTTACPLVPSYTNTGNTRCVTNSGYNTGVQEVEQQDVNPYTAYGTRWVYGSVNYSACPVQEDWVNTGGYTCEQGSGSYRTGEQTVEQYDQNPVTRAGYRWVSNGTNTSACPVTPDWTNTSNYRCVTGSGYNTGQQERQQYDQNPYSGQGYRWVNVGASSACPVTPDWATTGNYRCVTGSGYNTGQQEAEQYDINPYSAQGTRWVSNGTNTSACPVTPNWVTTGNYRCVTGSGYNTGGQEAEQYDANPYSAQGTRWVSNGTNTSACPITPDWNNTGIVRCVTSSGYNTGEQEREQSDHNPYSGLGTRWLSNGTNNAACPVVPDWVNQGSPVCEKVTGVENTGYQLQKQTDQNPVTNLGIRWVNIGQNLTACPLIVYVQLSYENMFETFDGYVYADVKLSFYHNSAMTIPAYGNGLTINYEISENCNSTTEQIEGDGEYMYLQRMALLVSPAWSCPVDYWLLTGDGYYIVY